MIMIKFKGFVLNGGAVLSHFIIACLFQIALVNNAYANELSVNQSKEIENKKQSADLSGGDIYFDYSRPSSNTAAVAALTDKLQNIQAMTSNFTQQTRTADGVVMQTIEGQLDVSKPNRLRWQTTPPYEQLVIADGVDIWIYDQDLEQVTVRPMDNSLQETPALLLSGNLENIADEYSVSAVDDEIFNLKPNDDSQLFDRLTLIFSGNKIQSLTIFDVTGQYTLIEFSDVINNPITNESVANNLFSFEAPADVDIIDGR